MSLAPANVGDGALQVAEVLRDRHRVDQHGVLRLDAPAAKRVMMSRDLLELRAVADRAAHDDRVVEAHDLDARRRDRAAQHLREVVELLRGDRDLVGLAAAAGPDHDGRVAGRLAVDDDLRRPTGTTPAIRPSPTATRVNPSAFKRMEWPDWIETSVT